MEKQITSKCIEVVDFHPRHIEMMDLRAEEVEGSFSLADNFERMEAIAETCTKAVTLMYDGRIICCAGFTVIWPGVADGWLVPSIYVNTVPISFCRAIKAYVAEAMLVYKCHRFQTTSYDDKFHDRWMNWMGFEKEGTMKKYTHNKRDHCIYARVE